MGACDTQLPSTARSTGTPASASTPSAPAAAKQPFWRTSQDVLLSSNGAVAVELPSHVPAAAAVSRNEHQPKHAAPVGALWHAAPGWLAVRLLAVVALARGLQNSASRSADAPAACAALTALYTDLTRPLAASDNGNDAIAVQLPLPTPGVFVAAWSAATPAVRDAAQVQFRVLLFCTSSARRILTPAALFLKGQLTACG